jgi:hypothetical protein
MKLKHLFWATTSAHYWYLTAPRIKKNRLYVHPDEHYCRWR